MPATPTTKTRAKPKAEAEPKTEPKEARVTVPAGPGDVPTADEYDPTVHANHSHLNP